MLSISSWHHRITSGEASCDVGPALAAKYKVDGTQRVVSVTNVWTGEQVSEFFLSGARGRQPGSWRGSAPHVDSPGWRRAA